MITNKKFFIRYENKIDNRKNSLLIKIDEKELSSETILSIKNKIIKYLNLDCKEEDIDILNMSKLSN